MSSAGAGSGAAPGGRPAMSPELEALVKKHKTLETEIAKLVATQTKLGSQRMENQTVKEEFALMEDDSNVFKRVGPVMVKQELAEAKSDVDRRIDFIDGDLARTETQLRTAQEEMAKTREQILELQKAADAKAGRS